MPIDTIEKSPPKKKTRANYSYRAKIYAKKLISEEPRTKKELALESGYKPFTANKPSQIEATKSFQVAARPLIQRMVEERDEILTRMIQLRSGAKYQHLSDAFDKLTKNIQLLSGGRTENVGFSLTGLFSGSTEPLPEPVKAEVIEPPPQQLGETTKDDTEKTAQ